MPDMLVKLYALKHTPIEIEGVVIRRPLPHEKDLCKRWVAKHFGDSWGSEFDVSFRNQPVTSFIAVREQAIVGFACYEATTRGFFGPTGVLETERGKGIGKELFLRSLVGLRELGYAYAVIGGAGPVDFYAKAAGALVIPDSVPGIYPATFLKEQS